MGIVAVLVLFGAVVTGTVTGGGSAQVGKGWGLSFLASLYHKYNKDYILEREAY